MFQEYKVYDLLKDDWPIQLPDGKVYYEKAQLHKGATICRSSGELILSCVKTMKESAGIRIIIQTIPNCWYKLKVRASLYKGDKAFILAQDLKITYDRHLAKLVLKDSLISRLYFFENSHKTEYILYFNALSMQSMIGLLFYSKDIDYEIGITDFVCTKFIPKLMEEKPRDDVAVEKMVTEKVEDNVAEDKIEINMYYREGIFLDFPLMENLTKNISKDLRKFGLGTYPNCVSLIVFNISNKVCDNKISFYIFKTVVCSNIFFYLYVPTFEIKLDSEENSTILELEVDDLFKSFYIEHFTYSKKHPIKIDHKKSLRYTPTFSDSQHKPDLHGENAYIEIRKEGKILFYCRDLIKLQGGTIIIGESMFLL